MKSNAHLSTEVCVHLWISRLGRTEEILRTWPAYTCLYRSPAPDLKIAAPYLVELDYEYRDTRRLLRRARGNHSGVFLKSET